MNKSIQWAKATAQECQAFALLLLELLQRQSPIELLVASVVVPATVCGSLWLLCLITPFLMGFALIYGLGVFGFAVYRLVLGVCNAS